MYLVYTAITGKGYGNAYRTVWAEVPCDSLSEARKEVDRLQRISKYTGVGISYQGELIESHYVGKVYFGK
jgi:hypothetical protein